MRKADSLAYSLTWEPPASPNGIIRFYKVCTALWTQRGTVGRKSSQVMLASEEREQLNGMLFTYVYCVQVYSNNFEVAALHPNQTSFTLTELTPGTLYLISVGAFTDAGEGEREERMIKTDGPTATPTGMTHCMHALVVYCKQCPISSAWCPVSS